MKCVWGLSGADVFMLKPVDTLHFTNFLSIAGTKKWNEEKRNTRGSRVLAGGNKYT
jgi:hypothetical protein